MSMEFSKDLHRSETHWKELRTAYNHISFVLENLAEDDPDREYLTNIKVRVGNASERFRQRYLEMLADEVNA
jgi:hypothetical protein